MPRIPKGLDAANPAVQSLFRMVIALLFTCHGASSVLGAFGGPAGGRPSAGEWPGWWAGLIQLIGGAIVFLGLGDLPTRLAAVANSGSMAYAYFTVHQKHALWPIENGGELSVLFCWSFLLIALLGPGTYTLTHFLTRTSAPPTSHRPLPTPHAAKTP
jgi:putative oxidoreductase